MKFSAIIAVAAATLVSAQGYNSTSHSNSTMTGDSRTYNVPAPTSTPPTAITSVGTITSSCGTVQIYLPTTKVYPLSGNGTMTRTASTYTGSSSASPTGAANRLGVAAGFGAIIAAGAMVL